jgi:beta-lactamase regulating signal transducer with metallopeptidase domain
MNASLWQLAGWTMIHSLWLGAAVALAGGFLRLACRRAAPNTRYAISLATLAALAVTPFATAAWLSVNGVPLDPSPRYSGERLGEGQNPLSITPQTSAKVENPSPNPSLPGRGTEGTPGRMPGLTGQVIDLANPNSSPRYSGERLGEGQNLPSATPQTSATVENPSPSPSLPGRGIASPLPTSHQSLITSHLLNLLPTLWLIGAPLTFTLLATGLLGSARLRRRATPLAAGPAFDACERLRHTLNITRRVALAVSDGVAQPILVGVLRPLILLPTAALAGWTPEQLDMVLLHELAHVRRWDNLVNLLQRIVESLLFFHPAVWLLSRQVRRDREECCDAAVIAHTDRPHQYAELLVSIASALRGGPAPSLAVASAMASHPLAGRIRRILNLEEEPMRITRRTLAATLLLPLLLAGAIFYSGASAQDPPPSQGWEQPSTAAGGGRAQGGSPREAIRGGIPDAKQSSTLTSDDQPQTDSPSQATEGGAQDALTNSSAPDNAADLRSEISRLQALVTERQKEVAVLTIFDEFSRIVSLNEAHFEHVIRKASRLDPSVESAHRQLNSINQELAKLAEPTVAIDETDVRRLQRRRAETAQQLEEARQRFIKDQHALLNKIPKGELGEEISKRIRRLGEASKELATHQLDLALAKKLAKARDGAGAPGSPNQRGAATGSHADNAMPIPQASHGAAAPARNTATASNYSHTGVEFTQLQNEIRNLESLIIETQKELVDYEVYQELFGQSGRPDGGLEAAIAKDLDGDPAINAHKQKLFELQVELQTKLVATKNRDSAEIKRLRETIQNAEGELAKNVSEAARVLRKKHAQLPKDAQLAAQREYDARRSALEKNLSKYEQELSAAKTKLSQLTTNSGASAPQPAPLLDRLEQLRLAFDQQRPLFVKQPGEQLQKVRYDGANLPDIVGDHWPYLIKGIRNEPGKPPISFNWTGLGNKNYELEVPTAAHEKFFRPMFDGTLPTVQTASPGSPNQDAAATGSNAESASPSNATLFKGMKEISVPFPFSPSEEDYNRIRKSLEADGFKVISATFDSIDRADGRRPPSLSVFVPSDWHAAPVWETLADGKKTLRIVNFAGVLGSPNQGGAATGSNANAAPASLKPSPFLAPAPAPAQASSAHLGVTVLQPPTWIDRGGPYKRNTWTTAYLKIPLPLPMDYFDEERVNILRTAIASKEVASLQTVKKQADAVTWLQQRLHDSVDGEVLTLQLRYGDGPDDKVILQAVIDAFIAGMKAWASPAKAFYAPPTVTASPPTDNAASVTVVQPPVSSISGPTKNHTQTTAYLKISFNRLPGAFNPAPNEFNDADARLTPQEIELQAKNCLAIVKSPAVLKAALEKITPRETVDMEPANAAWLQNRLSATFPGDGEILELKLEGGDAKEDSVLLQAVIDAFLAAMNMPPESPADPNAATKSNENAADALNPFTNFAHSSSPDEVNGPPTATFLYDGKTFDQWRDLWKLELNPERRIEAVSAMAAFSRAGYGDEAINAILDVAAEYDFALIGGDAEGKLKERIIKLFTDYVGQGPPTDPWLPIVLDRMKADPDKWRSLVEMLLYYCMPPHRMQHNGPPIMSAENVEILKKAVGDERLDADILFLTTLNKVASHDPDVVRMTKEALQSDDVEGSLNLLRFIGFSNVDELPEQLEFLFAADLETRQAARDVLACSSGPQVRDAVADKLLAILNDPNQSARHADAIRALAMVSSSVVPTPHGHHISQGKRQEIIDSLYRVAREGATELFVPAVAASHLFLIDPDIQPVLESSLAAERVKLLEESKQQIEEEKQSLLKGTALGEQRGGGFF